VENIFEYFLELKFLRNPKTKKKAQSELAEDKITGEGGGSKSRKERNMQTR